MKASALALCLMLALAAFAANVSLAGPRKTEDARSLSPGVRRAYNVGLDRGDICCTKYATKPFPHKWVESWSPTSSNCPKPGVIITSKKLGNGKTIPPFCANPTEGWVDKIKSSFPEKPVSLSPTS
ncbi:CC chemokine Mo8 [Beluga whale alphaherpesvirus 1]|uniref:CC chemokine Mo8 n=1 Tax=Beluga whale alphaherpesvirus 1 TaxID=1434720 RepID=A0A286MMA4_9ALPH|nr:CC chemokine Mo8 [Beluga whale alphaherpesvirus 1]ASW27130.1 CC chemokine Mo8 [Beluga whale alphaherpesvirus 1]